MDIARRFQLSALTALSLLSLATLWLAIPPDASACGRCGLFGNRCRFVSGVHHHVAEVVAAPIVAAPTPISIINNYPPANGAAAITIAPPGQTVYAPYGLAAAVQTIQLNPDAVLRQAAELVKGTQQLAQAGLKGYGETAAIALTLQASQAAPQAAPQAVTAPPPAPSPQSITLTLRDGRWVVDPGQSPPPAGGLGGAAFRVDLKTGKIEGNPPSGIVPDLPPPPPPPPPPSGQPPAAGSKLIQKHCGACHGPALAAPKGGVYLGGEEVDCKISLAAVAAVMSGRMPPGGNLSAEDKAALSLELASNR